jgi:heme/copper-type cytochrome/quinol oxidase subunit 3
MVNQESTSVLSPRSSVLTEDRFASMDRNKLGMYLFILSEATFFALLIIAYIYFHGGQTTGPNASNSLDPARSAIFSLFLFASSFTVWRAGKSVERQQHSQVIIWLVATVVLGGVFLVGQGLEYLRLLNQNITVSRNLFGTTFFTLTGFHGLHVFVGLIMLSILAGFAIAGDFKGPRSSAVETVSLYWHFVDVVWVVIFSVIYIWALFM